MTRRSIILVLSFCLPFLGLAGPSTAPAPFVLAPKQTGASPRAIARSVPAPRARPSPRSAAPTRSSTPPVVVRFRAEPDAWTSRTVVSTQLSLELSSTGASRLTTLTARRVMLAREQVIRTRKGLERTTTLRAVTATRNGKPEPLPAEAALVSRPLGVKLSGAGKVTGVVGLIAARDAVAGRPEADLLGENPATSRELAGATPEDDGLKEAWEADSGRYLGLKLSPGQVMYFSERLRLPFLARRDLPYFSESTVIGPVIVNGRAGVALDVTLFSLNMAQVAVGVSPTTGPDSAFADWARRSKVHLSFPEMQVRGRGRRVVALDGHGLLEQDLSLEASLTGELAREAVGATKPPVTRVLMRLERAQRMLSGPPELAATPASARSAGGRAASKKARRAGQE